MIEQVFLAGVPVPDARVLELARRLADAELAATADKLDTALAPGNPGALALDVADREAILRVLEDGPAEFGELRAVLLQEHVWRKRDGLA